MKRADFLRINLSDHAVRLRKLEANCRKAAYAPGSELGKACADLAACHAAAALIYETELSKLGKETR